MWSKERRAIPAVFAAVCMMLWAGVSYSGTIVVVDDEHTLADVGFTNGAGVDQFVANIVAEFGTSIHAYTGNFGATEASLATAMGNAGATYTTGIGFAFTTPNLAPYTGLLLGGHYLSAGEMTVLSDFVAGGGSVYIMGGSGISGAGPEAAAWNTFLAPFGIQMNGVYNGINSPYLVTGGDPILAGVSLLYHNSGNSLTGANVVCCDAGNFIGVVRIDMEVSEPAGLGLIVGSVAALGLVARRARRR